MTNLKQQAIARLRADRRDILVRNCGRYINAELNPGRALDVGFALILFEPADFACPVSWTTNAGQKRMVVALKELIASIEGRVQNGPSGVLM